MVDLNLTWSQAATTLLSLSLLYILTLTLQRLYLSPIAHIPGPKLAALSFWYEFYYDVLKQGRYTWEIRDLHSQYGPIIRINPYEVHISDPSFYAELYSGPRDKWAWSAGMFGNSSSFFGSLSHELHRRRRAPLNPFFSKASIVRLQPLINRVVEQLCERLENVRGTGEVVHLRYAFGALSLDVVMEYCFGRSYNSVQEPDFAPIWADAIDSLSRQSHLNKQMPWILRLMRLTPLWLVERLNPHVMKLIRFQMDMATQVSAQMSQSKLTSSYADPSENKTIFAALLQPGALPPEEQTVSHLVDEAQSLIAAGQVTTTHYLNTVFFHIISNPSILSTLRTELLTFIPDPTIIPPLTRLEQLPYLSAVILEGYRISHGPTHRLQRISPTQPLYYKDTIIPAGTPMSMTSLLIHENPSIFPDPLEFKPEQWLEPGARERLSGYLVNFSKGSRSCIGRELASAEIHICLAVLLRRFDFEIFETEREDIDVAHDFFNPAPREGSVGLRVRVKAVQ